MHRKLGLVILCFFNLLLSRVGVSAFEYGLPPALPPLGDISGEVVSVDKQGLILTLETGELREIRFSSDCQITLNGRPVDPFALRPVMAGCNIEAVVILSAGQAAMVHGFYYCVEAQVSVVDGEMVKLIPLNFPDLQFWAKWSRTDTLPAEGFIYLIRLNSLGEVK